MLLPLSKTSLGLSKIEKVFAVDSLILNEIMSKYSKNLMPFLSSKDFVIVSIKNFEAQSEIGGRIRSD